MAKCKYPTVAPAALVSRTTTVNCHAASVRYGNSKSSKSGVMEACFLGPIEEKSFDYLRAEMIAGTSEALALVVRIDNA